MGEATPERHDQPEEVGPGAPDAPGDQPAGGAEQRYYRGVAPVPQGSTPPGEDTGELPPETATPPRPVARVSRYRWRTLRRGARWTVAGVWFVVICWGLWLVTVRGDVLERVLALLLVFGIGALVFGVSRLLGRMVLEGTLGRPRRSAWVSHLLTFLLLISGGIAFLQQTWWVVDAWQWFRDQL